jgi:plastocyanin
MKKLTLVVRIGLSIGLAGILFACARVPKEVKTEKVSIVRADDQGIQRATITMDSYFYSPKNLSVQAGKPVELTLRNAATFLSHSFHLEDSAVGHHVHAEVSAGESHTVRFMPREGGTFVFYCDKKFLFFRSHRERGQEGRLDVR